METEQIPESVYFKSHTQDFLNEWDLEKKLHIGAKLSKIQQEIEEAVKYNDFEKLEDLGAEEQVNFNFTMQVSNGYTPLMYCAAHGWTESLKVILQNLSVNVNAVQEATGCNAFWIASYFGRDKCMNLLAAAGIDTMNCSSGTKANALHIAVQKGH